MKLQKTIKAKIFGLTTTKDALLRQEYDNWLFYLNGHKEVPLYSATKQQADRLLKQLKKRFKKGKEYPVILRNDCVRIEKAKDTSWSNWWFKVPTANLKGGLWCPVQIPDSQTDLIGLDIRECKLIRKGDHWSVHVVVQKEVRDAQTLIPRCDAVLGVDLGEVRPATAVLLRDRQPVKQIMASRKVREVRMHYNWLRQQLGRKKSLRAIRKIGRTERRVVDAHLHKLSKDIVQMAKENNATIVLGDLQGIRERAKTRGRKFRAKMARMPSYRLSNFIEYKALWKDVSVVYINEAYTSKTCHICGEFGTRPTQGQFMCHNCGSQYNADLNGAINIGRRFMDYMSANSGLFDSPLNFGDVRLC